MQENVLCVSNLFLPKHQLKILTEYNFIFIGRIIKTTDNCDFSQNYDKLWTNHIIDWPSSLYIIITQTLCA